MNHVNHALMLALALVLPVSAAPDVAITPTQVSHVALNDHDAGRSAKMVLAEELVDVEIAGPVARMKVEQTWRYDDSWQSPGDEASQKVRTSHLSALHDYWITEDGTVHRGIVRDRRSAKAEYAANLAQRRDPGLVEWVDEGVYDLRLYPVPKHGTKKQAFTLLQVLPVSPDGGMKLAWHLPVYAVEKMVWTVRVAGEQGSRTATFGRMPSGIKRIDVAIRSQDVASRMARLTWHGATARKYLTVTPACYVPDGRRDQFLASIGTGGLVPVGAAANAVRIPDDWLEKLAVTARAVRLDVDLSRPADAMAELRRAALPGPGVVLFANPFTTRSAIRAGWDEAQRAAADKQGGIERPAAPEVPGLLGGLSFEVPSGIFVPNFKSARERAGIRACFANQKTVAGAIEMFNLDKNVNVMALVDAPAPVELAPIQLPAPDAPPAGVEWSFWRDPRRMAAYRATNGLLDDELPTVSGLPPRVVTVPVGPNEARIIPPWLWMELKSGGYLQSIPQDPGNGPDSQGNYVMTSFGDGIICLQHGGIKGEPGTSAYQQLIAAGVRDPRVLARASRDLPAYSNGYSRPARTRFLGWLVVLAATAALSAVLALFCYAGHGPREYGRTARAALAAVLRCVLFSLPMLALGPAVLVPLGCAAVRAGELLGAMAAHCLRGLVEEDGKS